MSQKPLTYDGCNFLRQRLVLATLSGKTVKVKGIRSKEDNPGLKGKLVINIRVFVPKVIRTSTVLANLVNSASQILPILQT